jgi:DNA-binding beta-propeller fold protein YncE
VIDEQGTPTDDVMYRVDFNGTFTRLGLITGYPSGQMRTGGLAVNPVTGVMYAMNMADRSLYTIDPTTLAATKVGTGLGITMTNGVAGLDFTPDGRLFGVAFGYVSTSNSSVFEIDINTGLAGPSLGELGFVASSLAFVNVPEPTAVAAALAAISPVLLRRRARTRVN